MRYLSVCSGIEAASVAWEPLGWEAAGFSEIEGFPCRVLEHRFPAVRNFGDMTKFKEWRMEDVGSIDVLVGGTPCQAFSVAGLRKGLADPRGNLSLVFLGLVERFRPKWVVWENVPGVLSDKTGAFGALLGGLGELGYGFAYRVLDAQYFRVPQRRRRVFVVGCAGGWQGAAAVLFEPEGLFGDFAAGGEEGEGVAGAFEVGPGGSRGANVSPTLDRNCRNGAMQNQVGLCVAHSLRGEGFDASEDGTGRGTPIVAAAVCTRMFGDQESRESHLVTAPAVLANGDAHSGFKDERGLVTSPAVTSKWAKGSGGPAGDECQNLVSCPAVMFERKMVRTSGGQPQEELSHCLRADENSGDGAPCVAHNAAVRRLTPVECERLQGFPDNWTLIPGQVGKRRRDRQDRRESFAWLCGLGLSRRDAARLLDSADGPRYKAIGNSMAVPVMAWIGRKIQAVDGMMGEGKKCGVRSAECGVGISDCGLGNGGGMRPARTGVPSVGSGLDGAFRGSEDSEIPNPQSTIGPEGLS
jgi:DNA (cytosine-5)-methyltransferase 1